MFQCRKILAALVFALALPACSQSSTASRQQGEAPGQEKPQVDVTEMAAKLHTGVDVSHHSGAIDWKQVAAQGHGFAIAKATEGVDLKDSTFDAHWKEIKEAGLLRGAYHFYVTEDPPHEQASFFIENVQLERGDLAPIVDIELIGHNTTLEGLAQRLKTFVELLEGHYGIKPIIYTSPNFWDKYFAEINFGDY
ncbi:MAG TPA: GH25 family lysozyme, partial [Acidobacteriota bacterium]|nr:GH25 family lysozyme [Acidobacteriota bacterium]